jgi:cytochrome c oxidase subunit II
MSHGARWSAAVRPVGLGLLAAFLVAGCLTEPVTTEGHDVRRLYGLFMAIAVVVAVLVVGLITWSILRYRGREGDDTLPVQTRGSIRLEILWTVLPAVTIGILFVFTVLTLVQVESTEAEPGAEIEVTAFRWGWTFTYPAEDVVVSGIGAPGPEVVVPVGEPVRFVLTAADVIHAFSVPEFFIKRDANPGRVNVIQLTVEEPGTYRGQCAEFCGLYHSRMPFAVIAVERPEYEAWLNERRGTVESPPPPGSPLASPEIPNTPPTDPGLPQGQLPLPGILP